MECTSFEAPFCGINANDDREVAGLYCFGKVFSLHYRYIVYISVVYFVLILQCRKHH